MFKTFKEAKKHADKTGGVVTWWCSYSVHKASEYSQATCGTAVYVSDRAVKFFWNRYVKEKEAQRKAILKFAKSFRKELTSRKLVSN